MSKPKPTETSRLGHHLFTIDKKYCAIYYRGVIGKETDKTFLLNIREGYGYDKVLKTNHWLAVPAGIEPSAVLVAFDRIKRLHDGAVKNKREQLRAAENIRLYEAVAALDKFHPSTGQLALAGRETETEISAPVG